MKNLLCSLWNDEVGFVISAELILIGTILVLGLIVGLSEVQHAVVAELNDIGDAFGSINQSYCFSGFSAWKKNGCGSFFAGSSFHDGQDDCDNNECEIACDPPRPEGPKHGSGHGGW